MDNKQKILIAIVIVLCILAYFTQRSQMSAPPAPQNISVYERSNAIVPKSGVDARINIAQPKLMEAIKGDTLYYGVASYMLNKVGYMSLCTEITEKAPHFKISIQPHSLMEEIYLKMSNNGMDWKIFALFPPVVSNINDLEPVLYGDIVRILFIGDTIDGIHEITDTGNGTLTLNFPKKYESTLWQIIGGPLGEPVKYGNSAAFARVNKPNFLSIKGTSEKCGPCVVSGDTNDSWTFERVKI